MARRGSLPGSPRRRAPAAAGGGGPGAGDRAAALAPGTAPRTSFRRAAAQTAPASQPASRPRQIAAAPRSPALLLAVTFLVLLLIGLLLPGSLRTGDRRKRLVSQIERDGPQHAPAPAR